MFFFMLVMVGIDTEFGMLEGVVTPLIDMKVFPNVRKEILSGKWLYVGQNNVPKRAHVVVSTSVDERSTM